MFISSQLVLNEQILEPAPYNRELMLQAFLIENIALLRLNQTNYADPTVLTEELSLTGAGGGGFGDGRIDVLISYEPGSYGLIELKKGVIGESHIAQLKRYLAAKSELLDFIRNIEREAGQDVPDKIALTGILVGTDVSPTLRDRVEAGATIKVDDLEIPLAAVAVRRFRSANNDVFVSVDTYFKEPSGRDKTKYEFEGKVLSKGRLALAIVREIVNRNPTLTYSQLDDELGRETHKHGMFTDIQTARAIFDETGRKRHFIGEDEAITLHSGQRIAVSNQWGIGNIQPILEIAKKKQIPILTKG